MCSIKLGGACDWKSVFKIAIFLIFTGTQNPKTDLFADFTHSRHFNSEPFLDFVFSRNAERSALHADFRSERIHKVQATQKISVCRFLRHSWDLVCVTSSMFLRTGSLQTKLKAGLSEQQQQDLFQNERSLK